MFFIVSNILKIVSQSSYSGFCSNLWQIQKNSVVILHALTNCSLAPYFMLQLRILQTFRSYLSGLFFIALFIMIVLFCTVFKSIIFLAEVFRAKITKWPNPIFLKSPALHLFVSDIRSSSVCRERHRIITYYVETSLWRRGYRSETLKDRLKCYLNLTENKLLSISVFSPLHCKINPDLSKY